MLALKYGADKWGKHHYTPVYYDLFKDKREKVKKVVEIGTGEGASMKMWRDFFPKAKIYGADIDIKRVPEIYSRMSLVSCDQTKESDLKNLLKETGKNINLFVDDGSHKPEDQVFTCNKLMPLLKKGVIYVIEDVADPSITKQLDAWDWELVRVGKRYDDQLIIVRHKNES